MARISTDAGMAAMGRPGVASARRSKIAAEAAFLRQWLASMHSIPIESLLHPFSPGERKDEKDAQDGLCFCPAKPLIDGS
ncbi:MAG: hypothetical protein ACLPPF_12405 [Rhodomicrobium sp.]